jgi:beta-glucanase (GH16 family)
VANNVNQHSYRYCVDWNQDTVSWSIDGNIVRVLTKESTLNANGVYSFPSTPARIQFSVWDGGAGAAGTRNWAGGYINWAAVGSSGYYSATYENVMIQCQGDPEPTGPPARKQSIPVPSVSETPITVAVPELSGYSNLTYKSTSDATPKVFNVWLIPLIFCLLVSLSAILS